MKINFTKENYETLINNKYDADELCNYGYIGAVCYEIIYREDGILDVNFYLLGKDSGYGKTNGIPYSYEDGFYATIYDTYEETLAGIEMDITMYIEENEDLAKGAENTSLSWVS